MTLTLRYMRHTDIPQVLTIDRFSFSTPWTARSYAYEIGESTYSHMLTLEHFTEEPVQGWKKLIRSFNGSYENDPRHKIIGYGGLWNIMEEAHISTIAVHPEQRGKRYGELLLAAMIMRSINLKAEYVVLEVRVGNEVALKLYEKYEFTIADRKKRYYRDDGEDAYDMRLVFDDEDLLARSKARWDALKQRFTIHDLYTDAEVPNRPKKE